MFQSVLIFILFLGPLIFFHELGHFAFARFFGVRVEVFSIGFGPKIFRWRRRDTEYAISLIPLGGYVKMFGDDPFREQQLTPEEQKVAFNHKSKWARFWIVFGGPLANLILAFFLYFGLVVSGEKFPEMRLAGVVQNSLLYDAGFRSGDALRLINGKSVATSDDPDFGDGQVNEVTVERLGQLHTLRTSLTSQQFRDLLREYTSHPLMAPVLVDGKGTRWILTRVQGKYDPQFSLEEAVETASPLWLTQVSFPTEEGKEPELASGAKQVQWEAGNKGFRAWADQAGLYPVDLSVESIVMNSPADKAKLKKDDVVTAINGIRIHSFDELRALVQKTTLGEEVTLTILRNGSNQEIRLLPESRESDKKKVMTIGVYSGHLMVKPRMLETIPSGVADAIGMAFRRLLDGVGTTLAGYKMLITKEVGLNNIGGPLAIGKVASDTFHISLSMFFRLMAIISINLGVINLFPIPVLDGGHIMFLGFELVNRGPLSRRKLELAQRFGVSFLFLLIFIALFNDISRLIS